MLDRMRVFLSPRLRTKSSSLVFGSRHGPHPLAPNLSPCTLLHPNRAETREGLAPHHPCPRVLAGSMALAGRGSWLGLQETPHPSLRRAWEGSSLMRGGRRGASALSGRPRGSHFLLARMTVEKEMEAGSRSLAHWHPHSLPCQASPPSLVLETKP